MNVRTRVGAMNIQTKVGKEVNRIMIATGTNISVPITMRSLSMYRRRSTMLRSLLRASVFFSRWIFVFAREIF